jgi:hypothetical protein
MSRVTVVAALLALLGSGPAPSVEVTGAQAAGMAGARLAHGGAVADFLLCPAAAASPVGLGGTVWGGVGSLDQLSGSLDAIQELRRSGSYSPDEMKDLLGELACGGDVARGEQSFGGAARLPGLLTGLAVSFASEVSWCVGALDVDTVRVAPDDIGGNTSLLELQGSYLAQAAVALARGFTAGPLGELSAGCQLRYLFGKGLTDTVSVWDATQEGVDWGELGEKGGSASAAALDAGLRLRATRFGVGVTVRNINEPWLRWGAGGPADRRLERTVIVGAALDAPAGLLVEVDAHLDAERRELGAERWLAAGVELPIAGAVTARAGARKEQEGGGWLMGVGAGVSLGPFSLDAAVNGRPTGGLEDLGGALQVELGL